MNTLFIFGMGYSAGFFARQALEKGWKVIATSREGAELDNIETIPFDGSQPIEDFSNRFKDVTHVLNSIPPHKETGDPAFHLHAKDLETLPKLKWMGYLSTTGVYGNADGATLKEDAPRIPTSARALARKVAEDNWLSTNLPIHLFRLAGIYGPTRSMFEAVKSGRAKAIDKPGHAFSRIHVEDIAGILWASIARPHPGSAYNVCDNEPLEPIKVLKTVCELMGIDMPQAKPFDKAAREMSPMALTFWNDNKLVDNGKLTNELNYEFKYPDHKSGLKAVWNQTK